MMRKNASSAGRHLTVAVVRIAPRICIGMAQVATSAYGAAPYLLVVAAHIVKQESTKSNSSNKLRAYRPTPTRSGTFKVNFSTVDNFVDKSSS